MIYLPVEPSAEPDAEERAYLKDNNPQGVNIRLLRGFRIFATKAFRPQNFWAHVQMCSPRCLGARACTFCEDAIESEISQTCAPILVDQNVFLVVETELGGNRSSSSTRKPYSLKVSVDHRLRVQVT